MRVLSRKFCRDFIAIFCFFSMVLALGCNSNKEEGISENGRTKLTLHIGLIPEHNIFDQKKRYEPLAEYIFKKNGIKIEFKILSRYGNIIDNFTDMDLEGAFFGSFTGALALRKLDIEACARPEWVGGTSTYYGMIFVRKDSDIKNGADMKGKRFVFVDKATTAGWLLPMYYFKSQGIGDYRSFFKEVYFAGTHEGAIYDVLEKRADIGAAKNTVFYRLASTDPRITDELTILARSPEVPANGLCFRSNLEGLVKRKIKETLLNMDRDKEGKEILKRFGAARFIETTERDFSPVFEYAAQIGLDLKNYDYLND